MKKKFRILSLVMAMLMVMTLLVGCGDNSSANDTADQSSLEDLEPMTITLGTGGNDIEMSEQGVQKFIELVSERSEGKITIEYVNGGQLGSATELAESMELGTLKMAKLDPTTMNGYIPEYSLLVQPFLIKDYDHIKSVVELDSVKALDERLSEEHNIHILAWMGCGFRAFATKTPITTVADCQGIVLRSPEAQIYMDTFKTLGMSPTPLAFGEMYTALESGVVEGCEPAASAIYQYEFYKVAPYVCRSNHMFSPVVLCVATDMWNDMPDLYKEIFNEAAAEAAAWEWEAMEAEEDSYFQMMADDGATITEWENYQELVDLFTPYWDNTAETLGGDAASILADIKAATK